MDFDGERDEILFEPAKLLRPRLLRPVETTFDFERLKEHVRELDRRAKETESVEKESSCMTVEMKDFIEFAFTLDAEQLLPLWAE